MATDLTQSVCLAEIQGIAPQLYPEPVDPRRTALILVDMQGHLDRSMHVREMNVEAMESTLAGCEKLLAGARANHVKVVHIILGSWTLDGSDLHSHKQRANKLYASQGKDPIALRAWDSPDAQIYPSLEPVQGEILLRKTSGSAFPTTGLAGILHNMNIRYTVFAGKLTDGCMGLTAIDASQQGFDTTVVDGACYGASRVGHLVILRLFDQNWGRVRTVDEMVQEFAGAG